MSLPDALMTRSSPGDRDAMQLLLKPILGFDVLLILVYLVARAAELAGLGDTPMALKIGDEQSIASIWVYAKLLLTVAVAACLTSRHPRQGFAALAVLFGVLFIDDYFELHEAVGTLLEPTLGHFATLGIRPKDVGELVAFIVILAVAICMFTVAFRRSSGQNRAVTRRVLWLVILLAIFGVGFDMLHIAMEQLPGIGGRAIQGIVGTIEDGGEMITLTFILLTFLRHLVQPETDRA